MLRGLCRLVLRTLKLHWLGSKAHLALLARKVPRAYALFQKCVGLAPRSFRAHFGLFRAATLLGRTRQARLALRICFRLDARKLLRKELPESAALELISLCEHDGQGQRAETRSLEGLGELFGPSQQGRRRRTVTGTEGAPIRGTIEGSDFSSPAEWERFQALPPITREEILALDWNEFLLQLSDGMSAGPTVETD